MNVNSNDSLSSSSLVPNLHSCHYGADNDKNHNKFCSEECLPKLN